MIQQSDKTGFTLVEMAVVLVITGLLIGGMVMPMGAVMDNTRRSDTDSRLSMIEEALLGFAMANGYLPCPDTNNDGLENRTGTACTNATGLLPWADLAVQPTDGWGNRFTYRVTLTFADTDIPSDDSGCTDTPQLSSFGLCTVGDITITDESAAAVANQVPVAVLSHGTNGRGATTLAGTVIAGATGNELENADADTTFVYGGTDDRVIWI
ncbi:MAG: prepilin-type N-terminal cleavage/methylation domain-containing protein, partial [Magnetococcus sp. WYHC-3]